MQTNTQPADSFESAGCVPLNRLFLKVSLWEPVVYQGFSVFMDEILVFDLSIQKRYFSQVRLERYKEIEYLSRIRKLFHCNLFKN